MQKMISHLGRYEIIGELGRGAMGIVYKARDPLIDREVAIKAINIDLLTAEERNEYEARFFQEAKAAGRLNHPSIVTIYDVGRSGEIAYITMEYLQGRELRDILNETPFLPIKEVLQIVTQVALGLAFAHDHGVIHRDIKPSNIVILHDGHVKITDFGIARIASSVVRTQTGMVLGSPKYMSPEQVMGNVIDHRSDIFSLGVVLYEMLTGKPPFIGANINAIMYQTLHTIPAPPSSVNPLVPSILDYIVAKTLAKDVSARYQHAQELANDLRTCFEYGMQEINLSDQSGNGRPQADKQHILLDAEENASATIRLSNAFDSSEATLRLAAMTASEQDVEEIAKTLRIPRPHWNEAKPASLPPKRTARQPQGRRKIRSVYLQWLVVAIILFGLFAAVYF